MVESLAVLNRTAEDLDSLATNFYHDGIDEKQCYSKAYNHLLETQKLNKMERKLATLRRIFDIQPIEGADAIELAIVDGWKVVVAKNVGHEIGDLVVYCEIDSFLPVEPEFEFLRKTSYRKMGDQEGFRLKTIRLRGQISQGLILPLSVLEKGEEMKIGISQQPWGDQLQLGPYDDALVIEEGTDVTDWLHIIKYEPPIPAELAGKIKGGFPSFLRKTDEERIQNLSKEYVEYKIYSEHQFYVTEKLDGSSATFYLKDGEFGVCSRNLDLLETEGNTFWKVAREMEIKEKLEAYGKNISLQGELIGEGIQGNPYKIKGHTVKFFNVFDIDNQSYYGLPMFLATIQHAIGAETVPILETEFILPHTIEDMIKYADSKSVLNQECDREGVVVRSYDRSISFKAISNKFLLNEK
jgi:RNA ligase (TIGR02306 family)